MGVVQTLPGGLDTPQGVSVNASTSRLLSRRALFARTRLVIVVNEADLVFLDQRSFPLFALAYHGGEVVAGICTNVPELVLLRL